MRAQNVRGESVGDVSERRAHVSCTRAVIHGAGPELGHCPRDGAAIEEIDLRAAPPGYVYAGSFKMFDEVPAHEPPRTGDENPVHDRWPYCSW
jgi:hypothetical protein